MEGTQQKPMMGLAGYDVKVLMVLLKSIEGSKDFFVWLMENGYPELGAFSNAVRADKEAMVWLFKNHFEWLAILSNAIDGEEEARLWISKACHPVNFMFALACRQEPVATRWLHDNNQEYFLMLADVVHTVLETQAAENAGPYVYHGGD